MKSSTANADWMFPNPLHLGRFLPSTQLIFLLTASQKALLKLQYASSATYQRVILEEQVLWLQVAMCSFSLVCVSPCIQKERQKAAGELCFTHLIAVVSAELTQRTSRRDNYEFVKAGAV